MGYEGANVLFDTWVQPLMMGLEEHLLQMFREDFEFHADAPASHLGARSAPLDGRGTGHAAAAPAQADVAPSPAEALEVGDVVQVTGDLGIAIDAAPVVPAGPTPAPAALAAVPKPTGAPTWAGDAERELGRIPFFVRGKARRNTERYAQEHGVGLITVETLYEAKAHFSR
jgi:light-independent protochlorophyllide reductase subunit B